MGETVSKILAIIIVSGILLGGIYVYTENKDAAREKRVQAELDSFTQEIAETGTLTEERYEELMSFLSMEGSGIEIDIEHLIPDRGID